MDREEIVKRYEKIVYRWDNDPDGTLKRLFPEKYNEICEKLEMLRHGVEYAIHSVNKEKLIYGIAEGITNSQMFTRKEIDKKNNDEILQQIFKSWG